MLELLAVLGIPCVLSSPQFGLEDSNPAWHSEVVLLGSCYNAFPSLDHPEVAQFTFGRNGSLVIQDSRHWRRLLKRYWHPDSTGMVPREEPDWTHGQLVIISILRDGCGWSSALRVTEFDKDHLTIRLEDSWVYPCDMVAQEAIVLWVPWPGLRLDIEEMSIFQKLSKVPVLPL